MLNKGNILEMELVMPRRDVSVFSNTRAKSAVLPNSVLKDQSIRINGKNAMDGLVLLNNINSKVITATFFDPQYRGIMEKMKYGNEGETRQKARSELEQMSEDVIQSFIYQIDRVLIASGRPKRSRP